MKKVFVSVAVRGLNKEETVAKHEEYRGKIADIIGEYEDISDKVSEFHKTKGLNITAYKHPALYWIGRGLSNQMADADLVVFCGDLSQTRGCKVEKLICELYDIPHIVIK